MADPNKFDPKKQGETRTTENQPDSPKTMKKDDKNQGMENSKEYTEGGGFGKESNPNRDAGQNYDAKAPHADKEKQEEPRKEAVPNQQSPEKKQDKEQPVAGGTQEKSGAKN